MGGASDAARSHVELARMCLGMGDELRNGLGRNRWIHQHDKGLTRDPRDWRNVADEVEVELLVERGIDRVCRSDREKRISIGCRAHDRLGGDITSATRSVLDEKLFT